MQHLLAAATHPLRAVGVAVEIVRWMTSDLGCSVYGHDPVGVHGLIRCKRCSRRRTTNAAGRARWH